MAANVFFLNCGSCYKAIGMLTGWVDCFKISFITLILALRD